MKAYFAVHALLPIPAVWWQKYVPLDQRVLLATLHVQLSHRSSSVLCQASLLPLVCATGAAVVELLWGFL